MTGTSPIVVKVGGDDALSEVISDLRIRHDLNATSVCTIRVLDADRKQLETYLGKLGADLTVDAHTKNAFTGVVTEVGTEQHPGRVPTLMIRAMDASFALSHQSNYRSFENQTYTDAVKKLVGDAKLSGSDLDAKLNTFAPPYLLQEATSLAFLADICLRTGTRWHVRAGKLHVRSKPVETHTLVETTEPDDKQKLVVKVLTASYSSAPMAKGVEVRAWDHATSAEVVATVAWPKATNNGLAASGGTKAAKMVTEPLILPAAAASSADEAKALGASVADRIAGESTRINGVLAEPGPELMVDDSAKITGFGKVDGTYTLTRVEHRFGGGHRWETSFWAGYRPPTVLGATSAPGSESLARRTQLDIGVVSDIEDETGATRVKVSYPSRHGELVSAWARILGLGAGGKRGLHWVPEVGDEVVIGYLGGDPRFPAVIGGLWKADDASAPAAKADAIKSGQVVTRSMTTRLGSVLEFSDGDSPETTHLRMAVGDKSMPMLRLGADKADLEVDSGKPVTIKAGDTTVVIDENGAVTITAKDITLKADNNVAIEGNNVSITGKTGVDLDGGGSKVGLGSGQASLESSGTTAVKGTAVQLN